MELILYGKEFCHLCDDAEAILRGLGLFADYIDIASDEKLQERYSIRIPVLQRRDTGAELGWPFDAEGVRLFMGLAERQ
ncbi:MAG: glutaredoxin family protein [Nitrosomonadales bacterium]|nr:glutaredoxin family protein [Nitrosomonadales bacterium]